MLEPVTKLSNGGVSDTGWGGCPVFECHAQTLALNYLTDDNSHMGMLGEELLLAAYMGDSTCDSSTKDKVQTDHLNNTLQTR